MPNKRIIFFLLFFFIALSGKAKEHKHVLILHSYFPAQGWAYEANLGLRTAFQNQSDLYITLDIRYLDLRSEISGEKLHRLQQELKQSYGTGSEIDLIMAIDDYAWQFINNKELDIFSDIPAIFCSAKNYRNAETGTRKFTGLNESLSFEENVSLIKTMLPNTSEVLFLCSENLPTGQGHLREMDNLPSVIDGVKIKIWRDSTSYSLKKELRELPQNAVIFYGITKFIDNPLVDMEINLHNWRFFNQFANVPIVTHNFDLLNKGVLGGYMIKAYDTGFEAAQMAIEFLKGKPMHLMPVRLMKSRYLGINYKTTREFNISENRIPKNADVINFESSFWVKNRILLFFTLLVFILQAAVIIFLFERQKEFKKRTQKVRKERDDNQNQHRMYLASHAFIQKELQLPFSAISGLNKMLSDKDISEDERLQFLKLINEHVNQIKNLFAEYQQIVSDAQSNADIVYRNFNCNYLLKEMYEYAKALKNERKLNDITLSLNIAESENRMLNSDPLWIKLTLAAYLQELCAEGNKGLIEIGFKSEQESYHFFLKENIYINDWDALQMENGLIESAKNTCKKLGGDFSVRTEKGKSRMLDVCIPCKQ